MTMQIAKVRLRKPRRVFPFVCGDIGLQRDESCIVQTDRGLEWGTCVLPPEPCSPEMEQRCTMRVVRKVNANDLKTFDMILHDERRAFSICLEKINQRNLPMKLVDAEYTFDKRRVVFYFTAEDRVDFRELVRDLAHELRTRIELRHIQVRDEAKMVGGLGCCGLKLCCASHLDEFKAISMRMAKRQNLSLNPAKISGQCGRLLCCLEYENTQYEEQRRKPKPAAPPQAAEEPEPEEEPEEMVPEEELAESEEGEDWEGETGDDGENEEGLTENQGQTPGQNNPGGTDNRKSRRRGRRRRKRTKPGGGAPNAGGGQKR